MSTQVWLAVEGVTPPECNHALRNMHMVATSGSVFDTSYETLECYKCGVRKHYRVSVAGTRTLICARAIRRVA